jgi:N-acetylmuramoyl-L-alanine amidase
MATDILPLKHTEEDLDCLAKTIYGEARGERFIGQIAVAWVVRNRVAARRPWYGSGIIGVCTKPLQFSCWNRFDPNRKLLDELKPDNPRYLKARDAALHVLNGEVEDPTDGATHYLALGSLKKIPSWVAYMKQTVKLGAHTFYLES